MKKALAIALTAAFVLSASSAPALAGNGKAYGKVIKEQCGMSYGQLWKQVKKDPGHAGVKPSAKKFVTQLVPGTEITLLDFHCPVETE